LHEASALRAFARHLGAGRNNFEYPQPGAAHTSLMLLLVIPAQAGIQ
jgi:hypothetical protein